MKFNVRTYVPMVLGTNEPGDDEATLLAVLVRRCPVCKRPMIDPLSVAAKTQDFSIKAQMDRAGIQFRSSSTDATGHTVCEGCVKEGKVTVRCALCGESRTSDQIQETYGDPAECLCTVCYGTTPERYG